MGKLKMQHTHTHTKKNPQGGGRMPHCISHCLPEPSSISATMTEKGHSSQMNTIDPAYAIAIAIPAEAFTIKTEGLISVARVYSAVSLQRVIVYVVGCFLYS